MRTLSRAFVVCSLAISSSLVISARADDRGETPRGERPRSPDFYGAYAEDARLVRVVPLVVGALPDLTQGVELRPTWGPGVDLDLPPGLVVLRDGDVLMIGPGSLPEWIRFHCEDDVWRERSRGAWPVGIALLGGQDLDQDGDVDLIVLAPRERGADWVVQIMRGGPDGDLVLEERRQTVAAGTHAGFFGLGDVDRDGKLDLLFHLQEHGGFHPVAVHYARGRGDGTFEKARLLARGPQGASSIGVARLDREGATSIVLGADDDANDAGQAQEVVETQDGSWKLRPFVDLEPARETGCMDEGYWSLTPTDVDLDGFTDVVARWDAWFVQHGKRQTVVRVLRGCAGGFGPPEPMIDGLYPEKAAPSLAFPALD
jgi:hypothetical protein